MLTILGGGPAGLAAAEEATRRGHACQVFEASPRLGGSAATFRRDGFAYDSGAHVFRDRDPLVTAKVEALVGDDLRRVEISSRIQTSAGVIDIPARAGALPFQLGLRGMVRGTWQYLRRPRGDGEPSTFEALAVREYGRYFAEQWVCPFARKLWGVDADRLLPAAAGTRLREFAPASGRRGQLDDGAAIVHPRQGYGVICDRLAERVPPERVRTNAEITCLSHNGRRITRVEVNGDEMVGVEAVCSTLPVTQVLRLLRPMADPGLLELAAVLRFRHVVLVAVFLDKPTAADAATTYFPEPHVPFTRVVEPRRFSPDMAPAGRTSLVAEIPCFAWDAAWEASDDDLVGEVLEGLGAAGLVRPGEVLGADVQRLRNVYPVLELGVEPTLKDVLRYLDGFENLVVTGRGGRFVHRQLHDMVRFGVDAVLRLEATGALSRHETPAAPFPFAGTAWARG